MLPRMFAVSPMPGCVEGVCVCVCVCVSVYQCNKLQGEYNTHHL